MENNQGSLYFPPVDQATSEGLVAIGHELHQDILIDSYKHGIFPWPLSEKSPITWFSPNPRGILFVDSFHVPRSLKKLLNKSLYSVRYNQRFDDVIDYCSKVPRPGQLGTWITKKIIDAYKDLHRSGHAYSVEVYDSQQSLVGGLYGVQIGRIVSGESMFHLRPNTSKIALAALINRLKEHDIPWLDIQMCTDILKSLGAKDINRKDFLTMLKEEENKPFPNNLWTNT